MNKFNKSIQQVIQFALTYFMAMFALISGLQLVYLVKNGVTTQGLIRSLPRSTNTRLLSNSLSPAARPAPAVGIS